MQVKEFLTEDRAVSPVIGVILMVAITVILAAVIGTFVLGLGEDVQSAPQAQIAFEYPDNSTVNVIHEGGDELNANNLQLVLENGTAYDSYSGNYTAGQTIISGETVNPGEDVRLVWSAPDSSDTSVIAESEAPN